MTKETDLPRLVEKIDAAWNAIEKYGDTENSDCDKNLYEAWPMLRRHIEQMEWEIAKLKREKEAAIVRNTHYVQTLAQRDATIKATVQFIRTHTAEKLREGLLAILDKEQS